MCDEKLTVVRHWLVMRMMRFGELSEIMLLSIINSFSLLITVSQFSGCWSFPGYETRVLIAKFHYTGPTWTRTRTFLRRNSVGSVRVRSGPCPCPCPCRARVRVRVVKFSYKSAHNVTMLAFAAERRPCSNHRYLLAAGSTAANPPQRRAAAEWWDGWTDRQTDRQTDARQFQTPCYSYASRDNEYRLYLMGGSHEKMQLYVTRNFRIINF